MSLTRAQRCFTAWLAMLALVLGALAPTLAQAVVKVSDRSDWVQICSTTGMAWVKAEPVAADSETAPMADMGMQCPWCSLHSPVTGLPPAPAFAVTAAAQVAPVDGLASAPSPAGVWLAAPARAPPTVS
jgi:hypothetical protein